MDLVLEGFEELEETLQEMTVEDKDIRRALNIGIKTLASNLAQASPKRTGKLSNIKTKVKVSSYGGEAVAAAGAYYDIFQEFGTSQQRTNVGYFTTQVEDQSNEIISEIAQIILK